MWARLLLILAALEAATYGTLAFVLVLSCYAPPVGQVYFQLLIAPELAEYWKELINGV